MLRLRATLVATTAARPRRGGWSADGGVDLALPPSSTLPCPALIERSPARLAEPASFLEPGEGRPPGEETGSRPLAGWTADRAETAQAPRAGGPLRAWSQLCARSPRG